MEDETYLQYEVTALYDLTKYGMPGDTGESQRAGPVTLTGCPLNELDFYEDWSTYWSDRWKTPWIDWRIANAYGNEAPSALFRTDSNMMLYDDRLESLLISTDGKINDIFLEYDVSLSSDIPTGAEELHIQVFDFQTKTWNTVKTLNNIEGNYEWRRDTLNISNFFNGDAFKIGFDVKGENSADLDFWAIDNIVVRSECLSPINVQVNPIPSSEDSVLVNWNEPLPDIAEWREWDDGDQAYQIGFGIGKCMWAGCAVRWTPDQLISMKGAKLTAISFIPTNESYQSTQYEIAVWTGGDRDLVRRQASGNLVRDEWNNITLDEPVQVDITNELLVGYLYSQSGGFSMSADAGPAMEGYGNLVQFGTFWQTLNEINPDLNYNWNIKAWFERDGVPVENYRLYRSIDSGEPVLIAEPEELEYPDHFGSINEMYCYKLKSVYPDGCESEFSDEACILFTGIGPIASAINTYVQIFPNPSSDLIHVVASETILSIRIYNSFGLLMLKKKVDEKQLEIPVAAYPAGVYMIRVEAAGQVISKKVMVVH
jgi:hypothetical protein